MDRLATLKEELEDMSKMIKEDISDEDKKEEEIAEINNKIKEELITLTIPNIMKPRKSFSKPMTSDT